MDLDSLDRRQMLGLLAGSGAVAAGAGAFALGGEPEAAETRLVEGEESRRLAEAHAPTLYYGAREQWFPTDPREYESERDGETVVDGFDAFDGYSADAREESYPHPTVFYHVVEYPDSPLACVQFWMYSAFDQFSTNFHWHDWEVLHVFVDRSADDGAGTESPTEADASANASATTDVGQPVLFVASAHSRTVPNNEYLDPSVERASIISEVGSHSSTLGVNARPTSFQRTDLGELSADISNDPVEVISGEAAFPLAYGLPRDEGLTLPYAIPEYDGERLHEHERLPNVRPEDLLADDLTVATYDELANPPADIPKREGEITFVPDARDDADGDERYELIDIAAVSHITDFTGPQLSFSFTVPQFAEDAIASHLNTPGVPWDQPRFDAPTADISEPQHRAALADRYEPVQAGGSASRILGAVREATGADDAPGSNGVALVAPSIETVALLESDPEAVPSFSGVLAVDDPPEGEHRLTVNGAGMSPYSERLTHEGGTTRAGVEGAIPMSANEDAVKVEGESDEGTTLTAIGLEDDFAGTLYDGRPPGEDGTFGIYAHRDGAYTAEVRDDAGQRGALRVNPNADDETLSLGGVGTGKTALADYLVRFLAETRQQAAVFEDGDADGIDDVPTGQNVTDDVVADAVERANENAGDVVDAVGETVETVIDDTTDGVENTTDTPEPTNSPDVLGGPDDGPDAVDGWGDGLFEDQFEPAANELGSNDSDDEDGDSDDGDGDDGDRGPPAETGFSGVLRSVDAALLVAAAARDASRNGRADNADRRLGSLRNRLEAVSRVVERSEGLPPGLGSLAAKRAERMLPRVEAALDADP
ncbi:hypothetical protein [Halolamina litorea]|uniref:Uncharacterized protein n=1 Tax=Halolamina litorea TaxID=1515593 RepID=A0ABD6BP68_9EURY|nr:hypothetical protein [Halolamina litorea]